MPPRGIETDAVLKSPGHIIPTENPQSAHPKRFSAGNGRMEMCIRDSYNLDESLPKDLPSVIANTKLKEDYNMNTTHMILVDSSVAGSDVKKMSQEIEKVDGVKWVLGLDLSLIHI